MAYSPSSLQQASAICICEHLCATSKQTETGETTARRNFPAYLPTAVATLLLETLNEAGKLSDETLALFDKSTTSLNKVCLRKADVTARGLSVFRNHELIELRVTDCKQFNIEDIMACLGDRSRRCLLSLNLHNSKRSIFKRKCLSESLGKLESLQSLDLSKTWLHQGHLKEIAALPNLKHLDVSRTKIKTLSPLLRLKDRLRSLVVHEVNIWKSGSGELLKKFRCLNHLDISLSPETLYLKEFSLIPLLEDSSNLPDLVSLDISCWTWIDPQLLRDFVSSHPSLKFLGLLHTGVASVSERFLLENSEQAVILTGSETLKQLTETLKHYPNRPSFIYHVLKSFCDEDIRMTSESVKLVMQATRQHPENLCVQIAGLACLGNRGAADDITLIRSQVDLILQVMDKCPALKEIANNGLIALQRIVTTYEVLAFVNGVPSEAPLLSSCGQHSSIKLYQEYDYRHCMKTTLRAMVGHTHYGSVEENGLCVLRDAAEPIEVNEYVDIVLEKDNLKLLMGILRRETLGPVVFSHSLCHVFALITAVSSQTPSLMTSWKVVTLGMRVLQSFPPDDNAEDVQKLIGHVLLCMYNTYENIENHYKIYPYGVIPLRKFVTSSKFEHSFCACGILAFIISREKKMHLVKIEDLTEDIMTALECWGEHQPEMIYTFDSFIPIRQLLMKETPVVCKLWALWCLRVVCNDKSSGRIHCELVKEDGIVEKLASLMTDPDTDEEVVGKIRTLWRVGDLAESLRMSKLRTTPDQSVEEL